MPVSRAEAMTGCACVGDEPEEMLSAERATICVVTEMKASSTAPTERAFRPRASNRDVEPERNETLPPGARPPRRAQFDPEGSYRPTANHPAAARLIRLNLCQVGGMA